MTTIAWDGYTLASDSLETSGTTRVGNTDKLWEWDNGWFAMAGVKSALPHIKTFLNTGKKNKIKGNFQVLVWNEIEQKMYLSGKDLCFYPSCTPNAIGSGEDIAIFAMNHMGMSAAKAVAEAIKQDTLSGHPVNVVHLVQRKKKK